MKFQIRLLSVVVAGAAVASLAACSAQPEPARFVYEASASQSGGQVTYMETADAAEPVGLQRAMKDTEWTYAPKVNARTTTPSVTVSPPAGATAACRILRI